jgi:hypothetical protein
MLPKTLNLRILQIGARRLNGTHFVEIQTRPTTLITMALAITVPFLCGGLGLRLAIRLLIHGEWSASGPLRPSY